MSSILDNVHPERIAACFRAEASGSLAKKLMKEPRFAGRLEALLHQHYQISDDGDADDTVDRMIAGLDLSELEALAFRAGIVYRARIFVQEIRGPILAAFAERFGEEALQDARLYHDLAGERLPILDLDALENAIREEGEACLGAWIRTLPEPLSKQLSLKWPDDAAIPATSDADILARGPAIMRRLGENRGQTS
ncbi:hypothetical protein AAIB41_15930 [Brucella sp. BE17]|uniref:hypothetical protein n=1 Tax=Brucella sp. BE17 TaxID=3142977 RepID=UPI0031BBC896